MSEVEDSKESIEPIVLKHPIFAEDFDQKFVVLEVIREEPKVSHLVVEDLYTGEIYYMKRIVVPNNKDFERYKDYYSTLQQFSQSQFCPGDMATLWIYTDYYIQRTNEYEFLVCFEWGEPDCIDIERLTSIQTLKFLKNIVEILETTYNISKLTHNNVCLHNLVLVETQLKLAGWKPLILAENVDDDYLPWRQYIARNYGKKRLDMVLLLEEDVKDILENPKMIFPQFVSQVNLKLNTCKKLKQDKELILNMFNFEDEKFGYPYLKIKLDELLIEEESKRFDEERKKKLNLNANKKNSSRGALFATTRENSVQELSSCETGAFNDPLEGSLAVLDMNGDELGNMSFAVDDLPSQEPSDRDPKKHLPRTNSLGKLEDSEAKLKQGKKSSQKSLASKGPFTSEYNTVDNSNLSGSERQKNLFKDFESEQQFQPQNSPKQTQVQSESLMQQNLHESFSYQSPSTKISMNFTKNAQVSYEIFKPEAQVQKVQQVEKPLVFSGVSSPVKIISPSKQSLQDTPSQKNQIFKPKPETPDKLPQKHDANLFEELNRAQISPQASGKMAQPSLSTPEKQKAEPVQNTKNRDTYQSPKNVHIFAQKLGGNSPASQEQGTPQKSESKQKAFDGVWDKAEDFLNEGKYNDSLSVWFSLEGKASGSDIAQIYKYIGICYNYLKDSYNSIKYLEMARDSLQSVDASNYELSASIHKHLGISNFEASKYAQALDCFLKSFEIKKKHLDASPPEIFEILQLIGDCEYNLKAFTESLESFNCCLALVKKSDASFSASQKFRIVKKIGLCLKKINDNQRAVLIFQEAMQIEGEIDPKEKGLVLQNLANCYLTLSELQKSKKAYQDAVRMFESSNSNEEISRCFFYVGVAELREKYNQKALLNFQKSLEYRRKVTKNLSTETGLIHSQIGIVHLMTGDFEGAVKEFDTASKCLSLSRTFELMECYSNLGQAYLGLGKEEAAKSNFQKALTFSKDGPSNSLIRAKCFYNIGNIEYNRGEVESPLEQFAKALEEFKKNPKPPSFEMYTCLYKMGKLEIDINRTQAQEYLSQAYIVATEKDLPATFRFKSLFYRGYTKKLANDLKSSKADMESCLKLCREDGNLVSSEIFLLQLFLAEISISLGDFTEARRVLDEFLDSFEETCKFLYLVNDPIESTNLLLNYHLLKKLLAEKTSDIKSQVQCLENILSNNDPVIDERRQEYRFQLATKFFEIGDFGNSRKVAIEILEVGSDHEIQQKCIQLMQSLEKISSHQSTPRSSRIVFTGKQDAQVPRSPNSATLSKSGKFNQAPVPQLTSPRNSTPRVHKESQLSEQSEVYTDDLRRSNVQLGQSRNFSTSSYEQFRKQVQSNIIDKNNQSSISRESKSDEQRRLSSAELSGRKSDILRQERQENESRDNDSHFNPSNHKDVAPEESPSVRSMKVKKNSPIKKPSDQDFLEKESVLSEDSVDYELRSQYNSSPAKFMPDDQEKIVFVSQASKKDIKSQNYSQPLDLIRRANQAISEQQKNSSSNMKKKLIPAIDLGKLQVQNRSPDVTNQSISDHQSQSDSDAEIEDDHDIFTQSSTKNDKKYLTSSPSRSTNKLSFNQTKTKIFPGTNATVIKPSKQSNSNSNTKKGFQTTRDVTKNDPKPNAQSYLSGSTTPRSLTPSKSRNAAEQNNLKSRMSLQQKKPLTVSSKPSASSSKVISTKQDPKKTATATGSGKISNGPKMKTKFHSKQIERIRVIREVDEQQDIETDDELVLYIRNFLKKIESLVNQNKLSDIDKFLQKFEQIIEDSQIDVEKISNEILLKEILDALVLVKKNQLPQALTLLEDCQTKAEKINSLHLSKVFIEKIKLLRIMENFEVSAKVCVQFLTRHEQLSTNNTILALNYFFELINELNVSDYNKVSKNKLKATMENQLFILESLDVLSKLKFHNIAVPNGLFKDKRLECILILSSSAFLSENAELAKKYLNMFVADLKNVSGDKFQLVKEAIDTITAADQREMACAFMQKFDGINLQCNTEEKNLYFSQQALVYLNNSLDYFKKFKSSKPDGALGKDQTQLFFAILHQISTCCLETKDLESSFYFNRMAKDIVVKGSMDEASCMFVAAKIKFLKNELEPSLAIINKCSLVRSQLKAKADQESVEIAYYTGKIYERLKKREKAFTNLKLSRKLLDSFKGTPFFHRMKDLIDDAFLGFK